jgi:hypothetical protein
MTFLEFDVGSAGPGTTVEVTLSGSESDVFLVDSANLSNFKSGRDFRYTGGHYRKSPVRLAVPSRGNWHAVIVPSGRVRASVRVL